MRMMLFMRLSLSCLLQLPYNYWKPLNEIDMLTNADNMPAKWQLLIYFGQQTILNM
ncbi:hypothetical protein CDIOL_13160 [Clostridium diolis]|uniref:Uncharacterized protein n=1 Tax=Clostridium diolis TaxID=223919 RepID=A0AAV3VWR5_9CLOT|nr:hypothetical protein CDIOL_13160 [Clostridium diolis]